jgi:hypothetical protein
MNEMLTCPFCGFSKNVELSGIPDSTKAAICPKCRHCFPLLPRQHQEEAGALPVDRSKEVFLPIAKHEVAKRLFPGLALDLLRAPYDFFRRRESLGEPLGTFFSFGLLFGSVGTMLIVFWRLAAMAWGLGSGTVWAPMILGAGFMLCVVLTPIWVVLAMLINTLVAHFCLLIVGAGEEGLKGTFRVVAYSQAAKSLGIFPVVGGPAAFIWQMVIQVIGLREVHGISSVRLLIGTAAAAGFLTLIVVGCFAAWPK